MKKLLFLIAVVALVSCKKESDCMKVETIVDCRENGKWAECNRFKSNDWVCGEAKDKEITQIENIYGSRKGGTVTTCRDPFTFEDYGEANCPDERYLTKVEAKVIWQ